MVFNAGEIRPSHFCAEVFLWDFATKSQRHKIFLPRITQINANKLFSSACLISTNWNPPLPVRNFNCNRQSGRPAVKTDSLGRAKGAETQRILLLRHQKTIGRASPACNVFRWRVTILLSIRIYHEGLIIAPLSSRSLIVTQLLLPCRDLLDQLHSFSTFYSANYANARENHFYYSICPFN